MTEHPITPPPELVEKWLEMWPQDALLQAARWGANHELEACCEWASQWRCMVGGNRPEVGLRSFRRPKPLSLKEQALQQLDSLHADLKMHGLGTNTDSIRRALEALPDV